MVGFPPSGGPTVVGVAPPSGGFLGFAGAPPSSHQIHISGRMLVRGNWLRRRSHHLYFVHMFILFYISIILLALSKSAHIKISENKSEKTTSCRTSIAVDPAKRGVERTNNERDTLDFHPGVDRASPRGLMGLIGTSLLGTSGFPCSRAGAALPLAFGGFTGA